MAFDGLLAHPNSLVRDEPTRFDEMRRGAWDIHARVHDMDLNGVYASLNFPSSLAGFAGQRYQLGVSDPDLALAVMRAANVSNQKTSPRRARTAYQCRASPSASWPHASPAAATSPPQAEHR